MSHKVVVCLWVLTLGVSMVALAHAEPSAGPTRNVMPGVAAPERKCGPNEEAVRTLKLTAIESAGVRDPDASVAYEWPRQDVAPAPCWKRHRHQNRSMFNSCRGK